MSVIKVSVECKVDILSCDMDCALADAFNNDYKFVYPRLLDSRFVMVVDGSGHRKDLKLNVVGSFFYGISMHGIPILGDILMLRNNKDYYGNDVTGLSPTEADELIGIIEEALNS